MLRTLLLVLVAAALPASGEPRDSLPASVAERKAMLVGRPRAELAALVRAVPDTRLLELGRGAVRELGIYSARMQKQERVGGKLLPPQVMAITVREKPYAVRMEVIDGPKKGRRILYNEELRKGEFRVREAGLLGITALWLDLDSKLAKRDTNHPVTALGFGSILRHLEDDLRRGAPLGGHARRDEGFDARGRWCLVFTAPAAAKNLYAQRTRMCLDLALGLPVELEVHDGQGLLEKAAFADVRPQLTPPAGFFTPEAAGL